MSTPQSTFSNRLGLAALLVLMALQAGTVAAEQNRMVRYQDRDGEMVISYTIPAELARFGYDIITPAGRLIERVEPQLSDEEWARKQELDAALAQCRKELREVRRRYETLDDVDYARAKHQESLDERIKNAELSRTQLRNSLMELETEAARLERAGNSLTGILINNIETTREQIVTLEKEIRQRKREKVQADEEFDRDLEVLRRNSCDFLLADASKPADSGG